jgi:redox-sensing transcriptional repressor
MVERFARRIPEPTVVRLPVYQRALLGLSAAGVTTVSSAELAGATGVNAAKVRKDLSHLGTYGTPGTGYDVKFLLGQIRRELGLDEEWQVVIVGIGHLGHALAHSQRFSTENFRTVALFDVDPAKIGEEVSGLPVLHLSELPEVVASAGRTIGVIACPAGAAQDVCDRLVEAGVGAILNFAPTILTVTRPVLLRQVDFSVELQVLSFYVEHPEAIAGLAGASRSKDESRLEL